MSLVTLLRAGLGIAKSTFGQAALGTGAGIAAASVLTGDAPAAAAPGVTFPLTTTGTGVGPAGGFSFESPAEQMLRQIIQQMGFTPMKSLSGGRFMAMAPTGEIVTFNRSGRIIKPDQIVPVGMQMPRNFKEIIAVNATRTQFGIKVRPRKNGGRSFKRELANTRDVIRASRDILSLCAPKKNKSK